MSTSLDLKPIHDWYPYTVPGREGEIETLSAYRDDEAIAHAVAWDLVTHEASGIGARIAFLEPTQIPPEIADEHSDDAWGAFYDVVQLAAEVGYRIGARRVLDGFDRERATTDAVARAVAEMLRVELVGDGERFQAPVGRGARMAAKLAEVAS